jgi:hypothetical protein
MKIFSMVLAVSATFFATNVLANPAGRLIAVAGDVTVVRSGKSLPANLGMPIENGDSVRVAGNSTSQIRFSDESVVSLRPNTEFKIDDYQYSKDTSSDRSIFSLVKGGLRTITGLIGRGDHKNYAIKSATATIGIRGTHFTLVNCSGDCSLSDGSRASDGLYGGVTDGRISVDNDSGSREFGQQEFFYVANRNSSPERLLAPPKFFSESLSVKGGARARIAHSEHSDVNGVANVDTSNSPQDVKLSSLLLSTANNANFSINNLPGGLQESLGGGEKDSSEPLMVLVQSTGNLAGSISTEVSAQVFSTSELASLGYPNVTDVSALTTAFEDEGVIVSNNGADVFWGWQAPDETDGAGHLGWHNAWGKELINAPTSGFATYNLVGSTDPTDNFGRTGTLTMTGGGLSINFASHTVTHVGTLEMSFTAESATNLAGLSYSIPSGQSWQLGGQGALNVTCSPGCINPTGSINGRLVGDGGQDLAAALVIQSQTASETPVDHLAGVVGVFSKQPASGH